MVIYLVRKFLVFFVLIVCFIGLASPTFADAEIASGVLPGGPKFISGGGEIDTSRDYVQGELILKFKKYLVENIDGSEKLLNLRQISKEKLGKLDGLISKYDIGSAEKVFKSEENKFDLIFSKFGMDNIVIIKVDKRLNIKEVAKEFMASGAVEYAIPVCSMQLFLEPNDPYWNTSGSWGQSFQDLYGLHKLQTNLTWEITQGEEIVVAVLDTGLDYFHEDIQGRVWENPGGNRD